MRIGKRSLAGLASGALLLSGIAIVAAQPAQAAPTSAVYCAGNSTGINGTESPADISLIQPNCSVIAGTAVQAPVGKVTGFPGSTGVNWVQMTISGSATWVAAPITTLGATKATLSTDLKTLLIDEDDLTTTNVLALVQQQGVNTVTVQTSTATNIGDVNVNNLAAAGDFTITGTGPNAGIVVSNAYRFMNAADASTGGTNGYAAAIVHMVDASGRVIPLAASNVTILNTNAGGGNITTLDYDNADCTASGTMRLSGGQYAKFNSAQVVYPVPACVATAAAGTAVRTTDGTGVWLVWDGDSGAQVAGNYSVNIRVTAPNGSTYNGTVTYTISSQLAWGDWTVAFDKTNYAPGDTALLTICAADNNDRPVPDGLAWSTAVTRPLEDSGVVFNAPVFSTSTGAALTDPGTQLFSNVVTTYQGCAAAELVVPQTEMVLTVAVTNKSGGNGWAAAFVPSTKTASAVIGNPEPTKPTIMIEGTRGKGDNANMVFVEGTTTELAGKTVTPYFRFPGQTGFTAGTGIRTVDAQGNFAWERKTGKQIAVQFRAGDVKSNTVLIEAK